MKNPMTRSPLFILLADNDADDRFIFGKAIQNLPFGTELIECDDGVEMLEYLRINKAYIPDVIFLDENMPRKRGSECLLELKQNPSFRDFPVIIYSTHVDDACADEMYNKGAHYYIRKTDLTDLRKILHNVLTWISEHGSQRPSREAFLLEVKC